MDTSNVVRSFDIELNIQIGIQLINSVNYYTGLSDDTINTIFSKENPKI